MDRLGNEFLAGPTFTGDVDRNLGFEHLFDLIVDLSHRRRRADNAAEVVSIRKLFLETFHFFCQAAVRQSVAEGGQKPFLIDRLGQIVVGPEFGHLDGSPDVVVSSHHDDWKFRMETGNFLENLHAVDPGHHEIEEDGVRRSARTRQNLGPGSERVNLIPGLRHHEGHEFPDRRIVVHHPNHLFVHHGVSFYCSHGGARRATRHDKAESEPGSPTPHSKSEERQFSAPFRRRHTSVTSSSGSPPSI